MAQEASGHGLHDAATAFLEAATKKAKQEERDHVNLVSPKKCHSEILYTNSEMF
jgi:hypothetical protein